MLISFSLSMHYKLNLCSAQKTTRPKQTRRVRKADNVSVNAGLRYTGRNQIRVPHKSQRVGKARNVSVNKGNVSGCKVRDPLENPFVTRKLIPDRRVTNATRSSHVHCATAKCSRASRVFVCR